MRDYIIAALILLGLALFFAFGPAEMGLSPEDLK